MEAAEPATASLDGFQSMKNNKVSEENFQVLLRQLTATRCALESVCEEREQARSLCLESQRVSRIVVSKLKKECQGSQEQLYTCQLEVCKYQQAYQRKMASIRQNHEEQLAALQADRMRMQQTIKQLQLQLLDKNAQTAEYAKAVGNLKSQLTHGQQEVCWYKQELAATKVENQQLRELNFDLQHLMAQAQTQMRQMMKMLRGLLRPTTAAGQPGLPPKSPTKVCKKPSVDNQQPRVALVLKMKDCVMEQLRARSVAMQAEFGDLGQDNLHLAAVPGSNR